MVDNDNYLQQYMTYIKRRILNLLMKMEHFPRQPVCSTFIKGRRIVYIVFILNVDITLNA